MITFREFVNNQIQYAKGNMPNFVAGTAQGPLNPELMYGKLMDNSGRNNLPDPTKTAEELKNKEATLRKRLEKYHQQQRSKDLDYWDQVAKQDRINQSKSAITMP
jgi:hypothetical protein